MTPVQEEEEKDSVIEIYLPAWMETKETKDCFFKKLEEEKLQTRDLNYLFSLGWIENLYSFDL